MSRSNAEDDQSEAEASDSSDASHRCRDDEYSDDYSEPEAGSDAPSQAKSASASAAPPTAASEANPSSGGSASEAEDYSGSGSDSDSGSGGGSGGGSDNGRSSRRQSRSMSSKDGCSVAGDVPSPMRPVSPRPQRALARPSSGALPAAAPVKSQTETQQRAKPQMAHRLLGQWRPPLPRPSKLPQLPVDEPATAPPPPKPLVPRRRRKNTIWNYHPEVEVTKTTATTVQLRWKPPFEPSAGKASYRVQLSRDGWHFTTEAVTSQLQHTFEDLQPSTRYAATVLAVIEDDGVVLWDGRGFTHKIIRMWTRPALGHVPADRFQGKPFYTPPPVHATCARPRPTSAPVLPSALATPPAHRRARVDDPFERQTWILCKKSMVCRSRKLVRAPWKMPALQSYVLDGVPDLGAESLCAILQHAYDKADIPILEFVTEEEFCALVMEVFKVLGVDQPPDVELREAFTIADPDASGQVRTKLLFLFILKHAPYPDRLTPPCVSSAPGLACDRDPEGRRESGLSSVPSSPSSATGAIFSPHSPCGNEARLNSFLRRRKIAREDRRARELSSPRNV